ncbi:WD40 repeat domain-containing protein [Cytobacillus firmus]|uniref:WD40 repeat domain-containing protein n=1 Tax=Cytobacillus firmus TaxID=1399 RepID=UPI0020412571|nr:WD40 repeat domain-containing protein [Cytobacillus firmus]MCM3707372.1 WD40 repeat domain-containing protein [Cytobacillus firmus]
MHKGPITAVVSNNTGDRVFTGGYDSFIYEWDLDRNNSNFIGKHEHLINNITLSNDNRILASSSSDYTIKLFDTVTNELIKELIGHSDDVEAISFSEDDRYLISTSRDQRCLVWNIESGSIVNQFQHHEKDVLSVWIYKDLAFTAGDDGKVLVWDFLTNELKKELGPFNYEVDTVDGSKERGLFALGADDGSVHIYDANSFQFLLNFDAHKQGVKKVSFSPSGNLLLTAGYDHKINIWDVKEGKKVKELNPYIYQWERCLSWTPDEKFIIGASFGKTFCKWNLETGEVVNNDLELATPSINDLSVSETGDIATASDDGKFRINGQVVSDENHVLTNSVCITDDGNIAAWGNHAGEVFLVDLKDRFINRFNLNTGPINVIFFSKLDNNFYVGTYGGYVHVISLSSKKQITNWKAQDGAIKSLAVNNEHVVTVSANATIHVFNKNNKSDVTVLVGPNAIINDIHLMENKNELIVVSRDKIVRVFDLLTGKILMQHNKHRYSIKSITQNNKGQIISGDYWGYIVVWDPENDNISNPIRLGTNGISALESKGETVFASSYDGAVYTIDSKGKLDEAFRIFTQHPDKLVQC